MDREFYRPIEVSNILKIGVDTVYRWIASGKISAVKISRKAYRIPATAIQAIINTGTAER